MRFRKKLGVAGRTCVLVDKEIKEGSTNEMYIFNYYVSQGVHAFYLSFRRPNIRAFYLNVKRPSADARSTYFNVRRPGAYVRSTGYGNGKKSSTWPEWAMGGQ